MEPFKIFLSHCAGDGSPERVVVNQFYELLCEAFNHENAEREKRNLEIYYDGKTPVHPGHDLGPECADRVRSSDLVIACFFPRYMQAPRFSEEVDEALRCYKPMIEVRFFHAGDPNIYRHIADFNRKLVEEVGSAQPRRLMIPIRYDVSDPARVREEIRKFVAGGNLVDAIRKLIIDRAERNLTMFNTAEAVMNDLSKRRTTRIRFFLYDGGTTIRNLQAHSGFKDLLKRQHQGLEIDFLFVDTSCKAYLSEMPECKSSPELQAMSDGAYSAIYEALGRRSGLVHNQSPKGHMADVAQSIRTLQLLQKKFGFDLNIRKTCQLPIYRLIISREYVYYTHILPYAALDPEQGSPDYFSLRLCTESAAGKTLTEHFDSLWESATHEPSGV